MQEMKKKKKKNHRGGLLLSVENPQEPTRLVNLGIWINGTKHRVQHFQKAVADDLCKNCSAWGHLERSCRYGSQGRCSICSGNHRTEAHYAASIHRNLRIRCPNCGGAHSAMDDECRVEQAAIKKNISNGATGKAGGPRKKLTKRGAHLSPGNSRHHD